MYGNGFADEYEKNRGGSTVIFGDRNQEDAMSSSAENKRMKRIADEEIIRFVLR